MKQSKMVTLIPFLAATSLSANISFIPVHTQPSYSAQTMPLMSDMPPIGFPTLSGVATDVNQPTFCVYPFETSENSNSQNPQTQTIFETQDVSHSSQHIHLPLVNFPQPMQNNMQIVTPQTMDYDGVSQLNLSPVNLILIANHRQIQQIMNIFALQRNYQELEWIIPTAIKVYMFDISYFLSYYCVIASQKGMIDDVRFYTRLILNNYPHIYGSVLEQCIYFALVTNNEELLNFLNSLKFDISPINIPISLLMISGNFSQSSNQSDEEGKIVKIESVSSGLSPSQSSHSHFDSFLKGDMVLSDSDKALQQDFIMSKLPEDSAIFIPEISEIQKNSSSSNSQPFGLLQNVQTKEIRFQSPCDELPTSNNTFSTSRHRKKQRSDNKKLKILDFEINDKLRILDRYDGNPIPEIDLNDMMLNACELGESHLIYAFLMKMNCWKLDMTRTIENCIDISIKKNHTRCLGNLLKTACARKFEVSENIKRNLKLSVRNRNIKAVRMLLQFDLVQPCGIVRKEFSESFDSQSSINCSKVGSISCASDLKSLNPSVLAAD
jgi:hypothetical protein